MAISMNSIPSPLRSPLFHIELDPSRAGTTTITGPALMIGPKATSAAGPTNEIRAIGDPDDARALWGAGSAIARQVEKFRQVNSTNQLFVLALDDPDGGSAATADLAITADDAKAGAIPLYIAGQKVAVNVISGQSASDIAAAMSAKINALVHLPVTAAVAGATVTLTAKWAGDTGNDIFVFTDYFGKTGGEEMPGGVRLDITPMSGGAGAPDLTGAIAVMADERYSYVGQLFTDATSLNALEEEFGFDDAGRWGWRRQLYGRILTARRAASYSDLVNFGRTRNSGVMHIMGLEGRFPAPIWDVIGVALGRAARELTTDPARPLQTLDLPGILPAKKGDRFNKSELEGLLFSGIATLTATDDDKTQIHRMISTYRKNSQGFDDDALLDITTLATSEHIQMRMGQRITSRFPRHKLADDDTRFGPGQAIATPSAVAGELIAQYSEMETQGIVENTRAFARNLIVERDATDPNRLNVLYPPDLVNQLRVFAVQNQFRLQSAQ